MGLKKGIDRLSIVFAVMVMAAFIAVMVVVGLTKGFTSFEKQMAVLLGGAVVCLLGTVFGIRGIAYLILWVIEGFKEGKDIRE